MVLRGEYLDIMAQGGGGMAVGGAAAGAGGRAQLQGGGGASSSLPRLWGRVVAGLTQLVLVSVEECRGGMIAEGLKIRGVMPLLAY